MADLDVLFAFPPQRPLSDEDYDRQIKDFIKQLERLSPKKLLEGAGTDTDLLEVLNPSEQTLSYLFVLLAHISPFDQPKTAQPSVPAELHPSGETWNKITNFLATCDTVQIRYVPREFKRLIHYVWRMASATQLPQFAIAPIRDSILSLDPEGGVLTSNHLLVVRACLSCRLYEEALPLLSKIIHTFPSKQKSPIDAPYLCSKHAVSAGYITSKSGFTQEITVHDIQEYFLLGAMCYIALKMWDDAQLYLEHVLVIPTGGVATGMMVEAYRKWLLVGCLAHGYTPKVPKLLGQTALKDLRSVSKPYEGLVDVFQLGDLVRLTAELDEGSKFWADDGNTGLAQQLLLQLQRYFVIKLEKTYSAVPVPMVAQWLKQSPPQAELYLQNLIAQGHLNASIEANQGTPAILRFASDPATGPRAKSEEQQLRELQLQTAKTNLLADYVRDADRKLAVTNDYVISLIRKEQEKAAAAANAANASAAGASGATMPGAFGDAMDTSWDHPDGDDEDLMEELH